MSNYPKYTCNLNQTDCLGFKQGECRSIENCAGKTEIILSEQKEPCENCIGPSLAISRGINDMRIDKSVSLTIGDKIRESNESLAEFIKQYDAQQIDDCYCRKLCEHRVDGQCNIEKCDRSNYNGILEYINQPIN